MGTVELQNGPVDGPEGEADAEVPPSTENRGVEDEDSVAGRSPGRGPGLVSSAPSGPFVVASSEEPHPIPRNEPTTPAAGNPIAQDDPGPPAHGDPIAQDDPGPPAAGDQIPQNEPSPPAGGDPSSQNEPTGWRRIAHLGVLALIFALLILLTARLSAAFADPVAGPIGKPSIAADGRSGPAAAKVDSDRPRRFESADRRRRPELIVRRIHAPPIGPRHPIRPWGTLSPAGVSEGPGTAFAGGSPRREAPAMVGPPVLGDHPSKVAGAAISDAALRPACRSVARRPGWKARPRSVSFVPGA